MTTNARNAEFQNELTNDNLARSLRDAARRLESAAKDLRTFADQIQQQEPGSFTESVVHIVPDNVAHLAESAMMDVNSASRHLISAVRHSAQYVVVPDATDD